MTDNLFNPDAFEQMPGQMSLAAVESTFEGTEARYVDRNGRGWLLQRCYCCRQDFYTDPGHREVYCPRCMGTKR